jgi:branched-chain amino acid transport system permease protein
MNVPQQVINALSLGAVYSLFALGYALVFSVLGLLNLAHSAVFMWGAYLGWASVLVFHLPLAPALVVAIVGAGLLAVLLDRVAFYPLRRRNAPRIAQLISSIGASAVLVSLAQLSFGADPQNLPLQMVPNQAIPALASGLGTGVALRVTPVQIITFGVALVMMGGLGLLVQRTKLGQAMRTIAFDERIAALLGVPIDRVYALTFFIAGASAGTAGMLYALSYNSITPFIGDAVSLKGLTVIVLGGMGNIAGAVLGGFIVAALEVFSITLGGSNYRDALTFFLLVLVLVVRPQGLLGSRAATRA